MFSIHVERTINKPIEKVFAILSDHANYAQFKAIEQSNLLIKGKHETNGLGAVREIISGGSNLHEEIVAYEPPYKLGYKVVKSKPLPYSSYSWLRIPAKNRRVSEQPFCRMGCWRLTPEKSPSPTRCLFFKVGIHLHV